MTYWLDLFTGETWQQFRDAGATITGFRKTMARYKKQPQAGDVLLFRVDGDDGSACNPARICR